MNDKLHKILQVLDCRFWAIVNLLVFCTLALIGAEVKSLVISGISAIIWVALAIVEAIRESLPQRQMIHINCDAEVMERIIKDAEYRLLDNLAAKLRPKEQDPEDKGDTDTPEVDDEPIHRPLTEAPEDGTLVWIKMFRSEQWGIEILPFHYSSYFEPAIARGVVFATKEDALVYLYGDHYSTLKPENQIAHGTLPDGA